MIVLGLTGSIGMGKTTIATMMKSMHIPVHDSDAAVHHLLGAGGEALPAISALFPAYKYPQIYDRKKRMIVRKELGALIFNDNEKKKQLEGILHPLVHKSQNAFIRSCVNKGLDFVCLDIPLLFETGAQERVDYTLVVSAPYFLQRQRVLDRPHMNSDKFHAILASQMPDQEKCARADYIIKTGLGRAHTMKALKSALIDIKKREDSSMQDKKKAI